MLFQIPADMDIRQDANAGQPKTFANPTTAFFAAEHLLLAPDVTVAALASHERRSGVRRSVVESLERSLTEHADVWAELAKH